MAMSRSPLIGPRTNIRTTLQQLLYTKSLFVVIPNRFDRGSNGFRRFHSISPSVQSLLRDIRQLDTSSLCDAHKSVASKTEDNSRNGDIGTGIRLMNNTIRPMNHLHRVNGAAATSAVMAGVARTVSFAIPNDFLAVMRALALEATKDEVLVVDTLSSTRAVAGEIFASEARRKGLAGIVIDGPIRDSAHLDQHYSNEKPNSDNILDAQNENGNDSPLESTTTPATMRLYATGVTPYSGTTNSPGEMQAAVVTCGGIQVRPGDIVVGDQDGVLVGDADTFLKLVPIAKNIQHIESDLMNSIASSSLSGESTLASITNLEEHVRRRLEGKTSDLEFRV